MTDNAPLPARELAWTGGFDQHLRWGVDAAGGQAFWLRMQSAGRGVAAAQTMTVSLATFRRDSNRAILVQDSEVMPAAAKRAWRRGGDWAALQYNWQSGSFLSADAGALRTRLFTARGQASARLQSLHAGAGAVLGWPLGGLDVRDAAWQGELSTAGQQVEGGFEGATWQHWGRLVVPGQAMAHCRHFTDRPDAAFFGLGQIVLPQGQRREALALGLGRLVVAGETILFDRWWPAPTVDAPRFDNYRWLATMVNRDCRLEISIDGGNPRLVPWLELDDLLPGGGSRLLRVTPFAAFRLRLFRRGRAEPLHDLRSPGGLLMMAVPGAIADASA